MNKELEPDKILVLSDALRKKDEEIILGWALPAENLDMFLKEVDKVARSCGAIPFEEINFDE